MHNCNNPSQLRLKYRLKVKEQLTQLIKQTFESLVFSAYCENKKRRSRRLFYKNSSHLQHVIGTKAPLLRIQLLVNR